VNEAISNLEKYKSLGLKACEIAFTYGIYIKTKEDALRIGEKAKELGIRLSIHAPYYVNLNSAEKLKVEQWADKSVTAAAVFNTVSKTLFETLPYPTYQTDDIDLKTNLVYEHLKHQYFGGGMSIYGQY
jgi:sugar phosphate isomerase/epimerase